MIWLLLALAGFVIWLFVEPNYLFSMATPLAIGALAAGIPFLLGDKPVTLMFWSFLPLLTAVGILVWSYSRRDFIFSYATMMPGATLYFIIPGLISAEKFKLFPPATMAMASIYVTLCLLCAVFGWMHTFTSVRRLFSAKLPFPSHNALLIYCIGALLFSAFFVYKLRGVDSELLAQSQWSGPQTIYYMLTTPGYFVAAVAPIVYVITKKRVFLVCAIVAFCAFLVPPILGGKRNEIIEAGVILAVCWGLVLRRPLPKPLILGAGAFCAVLFSSIGTYRSVSKESGALAGIVRAVSSEAREVESSQTPEFRYVEVNNYLAVMDCYVVGRWPNFGVSYWNALVHGYIPGQIIGEEVKRSMQIRYAPVTRLEVMAKGMPSTAGSTFTGFSDTLQAFLFLGPLIFYLTGRFLRSVFLQAARGSAPALFSYSHLLVMSGVAITHSTNYLMTAGINLTLWMLLWVIPMQFGLRNISKPQAQRKSIVTPLIR
jgi:hypothetical protein